MALDIAVCKVGKVMHNEQSFSLFQSPNRLITYQLNDQAKTKWAHLKCHISNKQSYQSSNED
jgi:hypothetical protein